MDILSLEGGGANGLVRLAVPQSQNAMALCPSYCGDWGYSHHLFVVITGVPVDSDGL